MSPIPKSPFHIIWQ